MGTHHSDIATYTVQVTTRSSLVVYRLTRRGGRALPQSHYDFFSDKFNTDPTKGGQRIATMLMYLYVPPPPPRFVTAFVLLGGKREHADLANARLGPCSTTVDEGGETVFPASTLKPNTGEHAAGWSKCAQRGAAVKAQRGDAMLFWSLKVRRRGWATRERGQGEPREGGPHERQLHRPPKRSGLR